jgi:hypothetical protein
VSSTIERYRQFARDAAPRSRTYAAWAEHIAGDAECVALIDSLPVACRQPVLILSAARFTGLAQQGDIRSWLVCQWPAVSEVATRRATQTNDPRRTSPLVAALQSVHGPIALLEVGASAGLGLVPDRYSHVFDRGGVKYRVDPASGASELELHCSLGETVPVPRRMPEIVWRAGLERLPLHLADPDAERWLRTLVWPEERERARQLDLAIALVRADPPRLVGGDAVEAVAALAAEVPQEATLVVWSPAVLVYLAPDARARFMTIVSGLRAQWLSLDSRGVLDPVRVSADALLPGDSDDFILSRDGRALAVVSPHGDRITRWAPDARQEPGA